MKHIKTFEGLISYFKKNQPLQNNNQSKEGHYPHPYRDDVIDNDDWDCNGFPRKHFRDKVIKTDNILEIRDILLDIEVDNIDFKILAENGKFIIASFDPYRHIESNQFKDKVRIDTMTIEIFKVSNKNFRITDSLIETLYRLEEYCSHLNIDFNLVRWGERHDKVKKCLDRSGYEPVPNRKIVSIESLESDDTSKWPFTEKLCRSLNIYLS